MKQRSQFRPNSNVLQTKNQDSQNQVKKSRNIPAEIWLKRNVLKKLTLQLKFNKNSTNEYRKFREIAQPSNEINGNSLPINEPKQNISQILSPSKQTEMRKLSVAKTDNLPRYTENFFASNAFAKNGLKSYYHKSSACQGNNFINVSKAVILQNKTQKKKKDLTTYHKISFSHRSMKNEETEKVQIPQKRSVSAHRSTKSQNLQKNTDFLKVTTKELHFSNIDAFLMDCTRENRQIFIRRAKTEPKCVQIIEKSNQNFIENNSFRETKIKSFGKSRPKTCMVKRKKSFEFNNCQGWATGKFQREEDEPFSTIFQF